MDERICVYPAGETDFAGNGLGVLRPSRCEVHWEENGEYTLELEHRLTDSTASWYYREKLGAPNGDAGTLDPWGKYERAAAYERTIVAPVPEAPSMRLRQIENEATSSYTVEIYTVKTHGGRLRLRRGPSTSTRCLGYYAVGKKVTLIRKTNSQWYEVTAPDGKHGWMYAQYLQYHSTRTVDRASRSVSAELLRDLPMRAQPFDVYAYEPATDRVTAKARHVFWRLAENMVCDLSIKNKTARQALDAVFAAAENQEHGFNWYCEDTEAMSLENDISGKNIVDIILGDGGICETWGLKLLVDWFDIFLVKEIGQDRGVQLRYGKNILGLEGGYSIDSVTTRIIPVGRTKNGKPLYLSGTKYLQSQNEALYARPRYSVLQVSEAKVSNDMSAAQARNKMRAAAQEQLDAGCDLPECSLSANMVQLRRDPAYADYQALERICPGDTLGLFLPSFALALSIRLSRYTFDAISRRYTETGLGTPSANLTNAGVTSRMLGKGAVTASKMAAGAVGGAAIQDDALSQRHLQAGSVAAQTIAAETLTADTEVVRVLTACALTATQANLQNLTAGRITTDELYASLAQIAAAEIGEAAINHAEVKALAAAVAAIAAAQIEHADIETAKITGAQVQTLAAALAKITRADIETAEVDQALIDWAGIENLTAQAAAIAKANVGTAQINEANIGWAAIQSVSAQLAELAQARIDQAAISQAQIDQLHASVVETIALTAQNANFDFASAQRLVASAMILEQGVGGSVTIGNLASTSAMFVQATMGSLTLKGEDGYYYDVTVTADGNMHTEKVTPTAAEIAAGTMANGRKIVETEADIAELNAGNIRAQTATVASIFTAALTAGKITAAEALISSATIPQLYATSIQAIGNTLDLSANQSVNIAVGSAVSAAVPVAVAGATPGSRNYMPDGRNMKKARVWNPQTIYCGSFICGADPHLP